MKDIGKGIAAVAIMGGAATAVALAHETIGQEGCAAIMVISAIAVVGMFVLEYFFK